MASRSLFPSRLGADFAGLEPPIQWVHSGESRELRGTATVERGTSLVAKVLGLLTSLPPTQKAGPISVRIEAAESHERWTRTYANMYVMTSTLFKRADCLVEKLGPASLMFRLTVRDAGIDWRLERASVLGISLPLHWLLIAARIDVKDGRYHFLIDSHLRGVGRIVRYEGLLNASA
jgi:hypothetical protein